MLADRIGGGATVGSPAFYQSMFIGGQGNLMGYRLYRFAGQYMAFNNRSPHPACPICKLYFARTARTGGSIRYWPGMAERGHSNEWHNGGSGILFCSGAGGAHPIRHELVSGRLVSDV